MGKGNFILGTGSSSIGDVTFAHRNGQQIARVRVRKIKNPKSYGQAEQRMISAEVVKFYSPLSGVLETSFEGLSKSESYAKFLSINMNLARQKKWSVKKGVGFVPLPYQLTGGSLTNPRVNDDGELMVGQIQGAINIGSVSTRLVNTYNLQNGDQVTFIGCWKKEDGSWQIIHNRFFIDTNSTASLPAYLYQDVINELYYSVGFGETELADAQAFIFSRWDGEKWARSNSFMTMKASLLATYDGEADEDILNAAVATYMNAGGRTPISNVYLNGQDD